MSNFLKRALVFKLYKYKLLLVYKPLHIYLFFIKIMNTYDLKNEVMKMEDDRLTKLEKEVSEIKTRVAIAETNIKGIYKILDSINNNTTWMLRITIGAIIVAVMNLILHGRF